MVDSEDRPGMRRCCVQQAPLAGPGRPGKWIPAPASARPPSGGCLFSFQVNPYLLSFRILRCFVFFLSSLLTAQLDYFFAFMEGKKRDHYSDHFFLLFYKWRNWALERAHKLCKLHSYPVALLRLGPNVLGPAPGILCTVHLVLTDTLPNSSLCSVAITICRVSACEIFFFSIWISKISNSFLVLSPGL